MSKVEFHAYSKEFKKLFEKEKAKIKQVLPEAEVHHIGSTAVEGLGGKGIIDILVTLDDWKEKQEAVSELRELGFEHIHPEENGRIFLSRVPDTKYGDIHIHLVAKGNKDYIEKLLFRDYLKQNKEEAVRYQELKQEWEREAGGDRKRYGELKQSYIENIINLAKDNNKN